MRLQIVYILYTKCPQKSDIILKAIILKTFKSSSMKLKRLGVEYHKFILELVS